MECKSIQLCSSSTARKYDAFVSFRGEDIRYTFADQLFFAFKKKGIVAFRDDTNIKQGDHISTELVQAIEGSHVLIVVFSKNYATSTWCLQELAKFVDCITKFPSTGQIVLPVFYDVSPSQVRKQSGEYYGKAFAQLELRFKDNLEMVQSWRKALEHVASLSGWEVQNKPQHKEIEKIVERVTKIVGYKLSSFEGLVGMHSRAEHLEKLLHIDSNNDRRVVGICGMGGGGKTTVGRAVFERNLHQYDTCCYIDNASKVYRDYGAIDIQKQLTCQALNEENQDVWNISKATSLIKTRLPWVKSFIVLDNVDESEQIEKLGVDRECLRMGSRVIIISRDQHILDKYVDEVYNIELLNKDEARELFCKKAFKSSYIMGGDDICSEYEKLTDLALKYAQGLPLAIEVLGSFLCGKNICEWKSALDRLRDNPKKEVMDVLQMSFDGLEPLEKEIFLDLACFFPYTNKEYVMPILDCCGFYPNVGIRVLVDKSLITVTSSVIKMHDMLQELGKAIARQKAPNEPVKWSRLWHVKDFHDVMYENTAMDNLEAIILKHKKENITLRAEALSKMNRLRLLIIENRNFSGSLNYLSNNLRYLHWKNYPFTYFPSSCEPVKLVELCLPQSSIRQLWEDIKPLYSLKSMKLSGSKNLVKIPDLNLERLDLEGCRKLVYVHPSIGNLRKLVFLNLKDCKSLKSLPKSILDVCSLEFVNLQGCSKLFERRDIDVSDTASAIQCQSTSSIFKRIKLMLPPFQYFFGSATRHIDNIVGSMMSCLSGYQRMRELNLSYCNLLDMPKAMESLYCLERLNLRGNNLITLPCFIKELPRLKYLDLQHCKQLTCLHEFPLRANANLPLERGIVVWPEDAGLNLFNCPKLAAAAMEEGWPSIALSWMVQFLKFHEESPLPVTIVIPGTGQIPRWFNSQSVGDSIMIEPFPREHDSNWMGLVFCAAFIAERDVDPSASWNEDAEDERPATISCWFGKEEPRSIGRSVAVIRERDGVTPEMSHLCLLYLSRPQVICYLEQLYLEDDLDGIRFKLDGHFLSKTRTRFEAKHCGMRLLYKHDLEQQQLNSGDKQELRDACGV